MTAEQEIKRAILKDAIEHNDDINYDGEITAENIDEVYEQVLVDNEDNYEFESDYRQGEVETNIPPDWSRHYESKSVAMQLDDGRWVGWTYFYGGGKHGCPEEMGWMEEAYFLDCEAEEKVVTVRTFTKVE